MLNIVLHHDQDDYQSRQFAGDHPGRGVDLKAGDDLNVEVHEGGTLTLTPIRPRPSRPEVSKVIKATLKDYARTMKKLA